jgi:hypothetical protein
MFVGSRLRLEVADATMLFTLEPPIQGLQSQRRMNRNVRNVAHAFGRAFKSPIQTSRHLLTMNSGYLSIDENSRIGSLDWGTRETRKRNPSVGI